MPYGEGGDGIAYGASAAVMAVVTGAGAIAPDYVIRLLFLGNVRLKYLVAAVVFSYVISLSSGINEGGHYAHLAGAFIGFLFVRQLQRGNDWARPVNQFLDSVVAFFSRREREPRRGPKVAYRNPKAKKTANKERTRTSRSSRRGHAASDNDEFDHQERLDAILDKIKQTGYDSLNEEEKEFLFNASKK